MKHKVLIYILLILSLTLTGCGKADTENQSIETPNTGSGIQKDLDRKPEETFDTGAELGKTPDAETEVSMKNIALDKVPDGYYSTADQQGTLENFTYDTKYYIGNGSSIQSSATVYLPYGYDQADSTTRYNILYLQHGAYGDERTWMYEYGDRFKNMIDHMIEDKLIPPLIIVMPYGSASAEKHLAQYQGNRALFFDRRGAFRSISAVCADRCVCIPVRQQQGFRRTDGCYDWRAALCLRWRNDPAASGMACGRYEPWKCSRVYDYWSCHKNH